MNVKKIISSYGNAGAHEGVFKGSKIIEEKLDLINYEVITPTIMKKETINNLKNVNEVTKNISLVASKIDEVLTSKDFPLFIGGDHSLSLGSVSAVSKHISNLGVIWFDAHGDMNTNKTSPSGNIHGMILAALQGVGDKSLTNLYYNGIKIKTENVLIYGARDLDLEEEKLINELGVKVLTFNYIKEIGIEKSLDEVKEFYKNKTNNIHLSFDLDVLDPQEIPGVSVPVEGGFKRLEVNLIIKELFNLFEINSMDVVEYNPDFDKEDVTLDYLNEVIMLVEELKK